MDEVEAKARSLLAAEMRNEYPFRAQCIDQGRVLPPKEEAAIRAIMAALSSTQEITQ